MIIALNGLMPALIKVPNPITLKSISSYTAMSKEVINKKNTTPKFVDAAVVKINTDAAIGVSQSAKVFFFILASITLIVIGTSFLKRKNHNKSEKTVNKNMEAVYGICSLKITIIPPRVFMRRMLNPMSNNLIFMNLLLVLL